MLSARLLVGSFLMFAACLALAADYFTGHPAVIAAAAAVLAALGAYELCVMARRTGKEPFTGLAVPGAAAFVVAPCFCGDPGGLWGDTEISGLIIVLLLAAGFVGQRLRGSLRGALVNCGMTIFAALYVGFLLSFVMRIRLLPDGGLAGVMLVIFGAKVGDIGAYSVGQLLGRRKLAPLTSPNKTVAGAVGGFAASVIAGVAVCLATGLLHIWAALGVGALIGVLSQLGDLSESVLKRDLDAKDASASVPGFGGVLDILDSLFFASPAVYLVLKVFAVR